MSVLRNILNSMKNKRLNYLCMFIFLIIIECIIAMFFKDGIIRGNIGDILVVPCIYTLLRIIFPNKYKYLHVYVLMFAIIVELAQLLKIIQLISGNNKLLRIALGGTFDVKDIICYIVGYFLIVIVYTRRKI